MTDFVTPLEMAERIPSGCKLGLAPDDYAAAPGLVRMLIDRGIRDLHVVCAPIGGMQVDMLIGAGAVATLETSAVSLGEAGGAPCFSRAVRDGSIRLRDATCPAVFAGLTASEKGVPFMPIRGIIDTDVLKKRDDWKVTSNPFDDGEKIVVVSAIRPDIALFHAPEADRFGNVRLGRRRETMLLAHASKKAFVTVERISETSLLEDEKMAAGVLPAIYVSAVAKLEKGGWPTGLYAEYPRDGQEVEKYARAARSVEGFQAYIRGAGSAA